MTKQPYDFLSATFHFFQVFGRHPMGALWIAFWQMLLICAITVGILAAFWPLLNLMAEAETANDAMVMSALLQSAGWFSFLTIAMVLVALAAQGAWLRLLTRGVISPVFPFRLWADELRLFGVNFVFIAFWTVGYLAFFIAFVAGAALLGGVDGFGGVAVGALLGTVFVLVAVVLLIMVCLRFAAAPALTVHDRRFRLFGAVRASSGVAGMMFLSYLTLIAVGIAGAVLVSMIQQVALLFAASDLVGVLMALDGTGNADPSEVLVLLGETLTSPMGMALIAIVIVTQFLFQIAFEGLWHGVGAYVARRHGESQAPQTQAPTPDAEAPSEAAPAPAPEPAG